MTFIPKYETACDLAVRIPGHIAELLDADRNLLRRFREETISDLLVACILALPTQDLFAVVPNEALTGGDLDIIVVTEDEKDAIQFRIQAKKLSPHPTIWERGTYRELAHPHNTGVQASTLIRSSAHEKIPTIPLFAFYNPKGACEASANVISGLELASGVSVNKLIQEMVHVKPKRLPHKRLRTLQPLFFPFTTLLCKPFQESDGGSAALTIPSPSAFKRAVDDAIHERSVRFPELLLPEWAPAKMLAPAVIEPDSEKVEIQTERLRKRQRRTEREAVYPDSVLPVVLQKARDRRGELKVVRAPVKRPRVIMIASK